MDHFQIVNVEPGSAYQMGFQYGAQAVRQIHGGIADYRTLFAQTSTMSWDEIAQYAEKQGADGLIFTVPPYVVVNQRAALHHIDACMSAVTIPCGIYNNPTRLGVTLTPETIKTLSDKHPHFMVDKEALPSVEC